MNLVTTNPFRTIGLPADAGLKDITANRGKIEAHLRVGKDVVFPYDFSNTIGTPVERTIESVKGAFSKLNLPKDKLRHAIFWFVNGSQIDGIALNHLYAGNPDKALEILSRQESYSSLINISTINFILGNTADSILALTKVLSNESYRNALVQSIVGDSFAVTEDELFELVIDELFDNSGLNHVEIVKHFYSLRGYDYAKVKYSLAPIRQIEEEVAKASNVDRQNPVLRYQAGVSLVRKTKTDINNLKTILGTSDTKYQVIADKLAKEILHCGIDYFNHTADEDDVEKALPLQDYAYNLAVGKILKDRCKENVDILKRKREMNTLDADIAYLANELKEFQNKPKNLNVVQALINNCKPKLLKLKEHLGIGNELYLKISSAVAGNSLGMLVEVINNAQSDQLKVRSGELSTEVGNALRLMDQINSLDMNPQEKLRVTENGTTLMRMQMQLKMAAISQRANQSSSSNNTGCAVFFLIAIVVAIIITLAN